MPRLRSWISKSLENTLSKPSMHRTQIPSLPSDDPLLQCPCHPPFSNTVNTLCGECINFVKECHWINIFKLPSSQFCKVSKRQLKKGSHVWDGDASQSLNWQYKYKQWILVRGCHLCELMGVKWDTPGDNVRIGSFDGRSVEMTIGVRFHARDGRNDEAWITISIGDSMQHDEFVTLRMWHEWAEGHGEEGDPCVPEIKRRQPAVSISRKPSQMGPCTASKVNLELAKEWLETCIADHTRCLRTQLKDSKHPLRLVAVSAEGSDPYLYEIATGDPIPDYLTLSHCWGATMPLKLESSSLETHRKAIPLKSLSKTFQDAIFLVRDLGYQYIWIDSLCIIQDSEEDWQRESEFMGSIYRNSICTLAATSSTGGEGGLFRLRNILRNHRCQVWGDPEHAIYIDIENDTALENYREDVGNGPLNSRAWVLQERYLSPRVIHFTANAVYWDCHEKHLCDYGHELEDKSSISFGFDDGYARPFQLDEQIWSEEFSDRWKFSVEKYSQMNLTKESDRLVAFRGVVKYYEEFTGGECVSGLWKQFFLSHLLWRVGEASLRLRCSSLASVPSWSWAIIGKPIKYAPMSVDRMSATFWYPLSDEAWPENSRSDLADPDAVGKLIEELARRRTLRVHPDNGYLSDRMFCATYSEATSTQNFAVISGKLNTAAGITLLVDDAFTTDQERIIIEALQMEQGIHESKRNLLVCQWPDSLDFTPNDVLYFRVQAEGANRPKRQRFLSSLFYYNDDSIDGQDDTMLAPYALHTSGLMLAATMESHVYRRVGYFRAIETFGKSPKPHPKGVDVGAPIFKDSWFGESCEMQTLKIV